MIKKLGILVVAGLLAGCVRTTIVPLQELQVASSQPATQPVNDTAVLQTTTQPAAVPAMIDPNQTTRSIYGGSYEVMWREALNLLMNLGFRPDRQDYRQGIITTFPQSSSDVVKFWAPDDAPLKSSAESTVNFYRRSIRLTIEPQQNRRYYQIAVQVIVERRTNPVETIGGPIRTGSSAFSRRSIGLLSDYQLEDKAEEAALWYVVGREPAYEKLVLDKLFKKI